MEFSHFQGSEGNTGFDAAFARNVSQQSTLRERNGLRSCNDKMIQRLDLDQGQRLFKRLRQQLVGATRLSDARWMIMREDHTGSVVTKRRFHHFARVPARRSSSNPFPPVPAPPVFESPPPLFLDSGIRARTSVASSTNPG